MVFKLHKRREKDSQNILDINERIIPNDLDSEGGMKISEIRIGCRESGIITKLFFSLLE